MLAPFQATRQSLAEPCLAARSNARSQLSRRGSSGFGTCPAS